LKQFINIEAGLLQVLPFLLQFADTFQIFKLWKRDYGKGHLGKVPTRRINCEKLIDPKKFEFLFFAKL